MSETPETPGTGTPAPAGQTATQAQPNALQLIENEIRGFIKQHEQAVAHVHAIEGGIQAAQRLYAILRGAADKALAAVESEATKAELAVEHVAREVATDADTVAKDVEKEASNVIQFVKKEL